MIIIRKSHGLFVLTWIFVVSLGLVTMAEDGKPLSASGATEKAQDSDPPKPGSEDSGDWLVNRTIVTTAIVLLVIVVSLLVRSALYPETNYIQKLGPPFFFWLGILYLGVLLTVAVLHVSKVYDTNMDEMIGGVLPIAVPWFGALGAVTISLQGVFDFNDNWNTKYNYWHIGRPVFGAVLGIVAFFLFGLIISATGSSPIPERDPNGKIIYYVLAFVVGYREATFRELLQRATDLILKPGEPPRAATQTADVVFKSGGTPRAVIDFGRVTQGRTDKRLLEVHNTGTAVLAAPSVQIFGASEFKTHDDKVSDRDLPPGQSSTFEILFAPTAARQFHSTVTVSSSSLPADKTISVSGTGTGEPADTNEAKAKPRKGASEPPTGGVPQD